MDMTIRRVAAAASSRTKLIGPARAHGEPRMAHAVQRITAQAGRIRTVARRRQLEVRAVSA